MAYSRLAPVLVAAAQALTEEVLVLRAANAALEARVRRLEAERLEPGLTGEGLIETGGVSGTKAEKKAGPIAGFGAVPPPVAAALAALAARLEALEGTGAR